jgi:NAD(P)-dependent dehydrogenase (short-subunit alcohol dehydrogenase family)
MAALTGRVAIITGAGRGIGREHALLFAQLGARVVVNDLGSAPDGSGAGASPADEVVATIRARGGSAIANYDDVADSAGAQRLLQAAVDEFGQLDVLVNNAGILRDRMLVNMTDAEWDAVIRVHLRGHFLPLRAAAAHWRERTKNGEAVAASVVNTSSTSGLHANPGQLNYGAAKTGIATMTEIAAKELARYGVRVNAIAPVAATRLTEQALEAAGELKDNGQEKWSPSNVSPFVAYLATAGCTLTGKVFGVRGGTVQLYQPYTIIDQISHEGRWTVDELVTAAAKWGACRPR